jgi:hypothetical protein
LPTPTPLPTATPPRTPPTIAPARPAITPTVALPQEATRLEFTAEDWVGGFYRGDGRAYGRPWVAVYGAFSAYPRVSLSFLLKDRPRGEATFILTGLDDEWAGTNGIALEVNNQVVFSGPNPFQSWDGVGNGRDAAWTEVAFTIPNGVLRRGENEIAIANLAPASTFNAPPYLLLGDATLVLTPGRDRG